MRETFPLKPIDKEPLSGMSKYPGCNGSERRSSFIKEEIHWPSLLILGEGRTDKGFHKTARN